MEMQPLTSVKSELESREVNGLDRYFGLGLRVTLCRRIAWLVALLLLQSVSASMIEATGPRGVVLAYIPMVAGSGGCAGNQAVVAVTRAIGCGVSNADAWRIARRETIGSFATSLAMAAAAFARVAATEDAGVAAAVAATVWVVAATAVISGTSLTLLLTRISVDPADAAAPLLSTLMDLMGVGVLMAASTMLVTCNTCGVRAQAEH